MTENKVYSKIHSICTVYNSHRIKGPIHIHYFLINYLGHSNYIVWSTTSDKGVLYVVEGKKIKIKIWILILVGGKIKKQLESTRSIYIYAVFEKKSFIFVHVEGKNKKRMKCQISFSSGMISLRRRTSSTKQYSESGLILSL